MTVLQCAARDMTAIQMTSKFLFNFYGPKRLCIIRFRNPINDEEKLLDLQIPDLEDPLDTTSQIPLKKGSQLLVNHREILDIWRKNYKKPTRLARFVYKLILSEEELAKCSPTGKGNHSLLPHFEDVFSKFIYH